MVQWWSKAHDVVLELKMTRTDLENLVRQSDEEYVFRGQLREFLGLVSKHEVPLLVFSAGLGDVIHQLMKNHNLWTKDMALVSNMMVFDKYDVCVGFSEPLIHVLNKNEACLGNDLHAAKIDNRESVILMGDSIGDLKMADGIEHDVKLTIGFCNHDPEKLLELYKDAFDIVLTNDTSLEFMIRLISVLILNRH
jgi:cytosolic 5'-nucleotidase 3